MKSHAKLDHMIKELLALSSLLGNDSKTDGRKLELEYHLDMLGFMLIIINTMDRKGRESLSRKKYLKCQK